MLHNPVFLAEDIQRLRELVEARGLTEEEKSLDRSKLVGRVLLFHDVLAAGLRSLHEAEVSTR